jgi:ribosomal subunit interface protein
MDVNVQGKQMDVGDALRSYIQDKLEQIDEKYFNRGIDATVTIMPEGAAFYKTHISLRGGKDILLQSYATAKDVYSSFDDAADKVAKQLRRYKKKLRDHHERLRATPEHEITKARDYVLAMSGESPDQEDEQDNDVPEGEDPVVVAETSTQIQTLSVSDAVMRMDLLDQPALLFRNPSHNGINMVYRRADGAIGWVDPVEAPAQEAAE